MSEECTAPVFRAIQRDTPEAAVPLARFAVLLSYEVHDTTFRYPLKRGHASLGNRLRLPV